MYGETGLIYPYLQGYPQDFEQLNDFCSIQKLNASMGNLTQASSILEYNLGEEGDLFKAPEPIIEEPLMDLDPMTAAISMMSCGEDVISSQGLKVSEIDSSFANGELLSDVFYECKKDIMAKEATDTLLSEVMEFKIPMMKTDELSQGQFQKSVSSENLSSMDWMHAGSSRPNFLDFPGLDFGTAFGMRRAFSEGDIKTLGTSNTSQSPLGQLQLCSSSTTDNRQEKLLRYRTKKSKRNFGRKIKYACRKALADSQPRIRGRFAKTEELDASKKW